MFCVKCGKEIHDDAVICPHCGCATSNFAAQSNNKNTNVYDAPSAGYAVLGFLVPLVGLILYLIWKEEFPLRAKSAGKGALIAVIIEIAAVVLFYLLMIILMASAAAAGVVPVLII